jgi:hypothetical protein
MMAPACFSSFPRWRLVPDGCLRSSWPGEATRHCFALRFRCFQAILPIGVKIGVTTRIGPVEKKTWMAGISARSKASSPRPAMTGCACSSIPQRRKPTFSPRFAPEFCSIMVPRKQRAQGMPGVRCTRSLACELKSTRDSHHRSPQRSGIPCAMVLTVSFVLFPVTGLFCHRGLRDRARRLGISVGMPEPHDFAVRKKCRSSGDTPASIASRFTFRDDCAYAPLTRGGMARTIRLIWVSEKAKYFSRTHWTDVDA